MSQRRVEAEGWAEGRKAQTEIEKERKKAMDSSLMKGVMGDKVPLGHATSEPDHPQHQKLPKVIRGQWKDE